MEGLKCFVAVEFPDDPNVEGLTYWYLCPDVSVGVGDEVIAPLGRHNRTQKGIVRRRLIATEQNSPFPYHLIKSIEKVLKIKE